jgi:hypothetical protein
MAAETLRSDGGESSRCEHGCWKAFDTQFARLQRDGRADVAIEMAHIRCAVREGKFPFDPEGLDGTSTWDDGEPLTVPDPDMPFPDFIRFEGEDPFIAARRATIYHRLVRSIPRDAELRLDDEQQEQGDGRIPA